MGIEMFNGRPYGGVDPNAVKWNDNREIGATNQIQPAGFVSQLMYGVGINNAHGIYTANGTATQDIEIFITDLMSIEGDYILSGAPEGSSASTYYICVRDDEDNDVSVDYGNGDTYSYTYDDYYGVYLVIKSGTVLSDVVFKPMLRIASDPDSTFQYFSASNKWLSESYGFLFNLVDNKADIEQLEVTTLAVDLTNWTQDTTSQSGSTLYKKQISLNHIYAERPSVDIGAASGSILPTTAEQEAYNLIQYVTVDDTVPCLYLYASDIPTTAFYINVIGVG